MDTKNTLKSSGSQDEEDRLVEDIHERREAAWGARDRYFNRWPALIAILAALSLYVTLPGHLYLGKVWIVPSIEIALFVALLTARRVEDEGYEWQRGLTICLIAVMNLANLSSLFLLVHGLVSSATVNGFRITPLHLIIWSTQIWLTNVIVYGLWYWELDRGGPVARCLPHHRAPDFLFPQMANPDAAPEGWDPSFFDYLYTSFTNAAAFSPTDTMPLSEWAKALFLVQSFTSISMAVLVTGRIANILP